MLVRLPRRGRGGVSGRALGAPSGQRRIEVRQGFGLHSRFCTAWRQTVSAMSRRSGLSPAPVSYGVNQHRQAHGPNLSNHCFVREYSTSAISQSVLPSRGLRFALGHVAPDARHRLQILAFWPRHGLAATREAFAISSRTVFRWRARLRAASGNAQRWLPVGPHRSGAAGGSGPWPWWRKSAACGKTPQCERIAARCIACNSSMSEISICLEYPVGMIQKSGNFPSKTVLVDKVVNSNGTSPARLPSTSPPIGMLPQDTENERSLRTLQSPIQKECIDYHYD